MSNRHRHVGFPLTLGLGVCLGLLALTLCPASAWSHSEHDLLDLSLEEILNIPVVSVSKTEKPLLDSAVSAVVVSRREIRENGYRDLIDVLRDLPGVYVVDLTSSEHAASEVLVRGVDANSKMLFLLDGEKISSPTGEPFTFLRNIPLISVKQIELSYGAASSLYGTDAIAGIVNVVTEDGAEDHSAEGWFRSGSNRTYEAQAHQRVALGRDVTLSLTGAFFTSSQEDLKEAYPKTFGGFDVDPLLKSHTFHAKLSAGDFDLTYLRLFGSRNNSLGFQPSLYDYSGNSTWDTETDFWNLGWSIGGTGSWLGRTTITHSRNELEPTSTYSYDFSGSQEFEDHSFYWEGQSTRTAAEAQWRGNRVTWLGGGEFEWFESIPKTDIDYPLGSYDIHYRNVGAFSQLEVQATSWLGLTAGLRYDNDSRFPHQWNPRLGALVHPARGIRLHASWGTAYLAPSSHKSYERWGVIQEGEYVHLPNPDLQPEKSETFNMGIDWFPTDRSRLVFAGFHTRADDLWRIAFMGPIEIDGVNVVYQTNANLAESTINGIHASGVLELSATWSIHGHYTLTAGTQTSVGLAGTVDLNHMPRHLYLAGLDWKGQSTTVRILGRGFDEVTSNEANTELAGATVAGSLTADVLVERRLRNADWDLSIGLDAQNVFDRSYTKISKFDEFFFALPRTPQPRRSIGVFLRAAL